MAKNIILCADGTGNKGGYTPDSNVYKIYKSIEKNPDKGIRESLGIDEQIVFYDNGVGTNKNKFFRALSGGLGFGFGQNVRDLYKFLARNYEGGDRVYLFGFSRGASTIRAFNGFVHTCGLIDGHARTLSNRDLDKKVKEAFKAYRWHSIKKKWWYWVAWWYWLTTCCHKLTSCRCCNSECRTAEELKIRRADVSHGVIDIHFTGIWDTVVALGFPKRTDAVTPVSWALKVAFGLFERVADWLIPHSFYIYRLTGNQKYAYQALAVDDERTAFWPYVWDEKVSPDTVVEQVWFAGMHSNIGGGYNRSGLASIPLYWMMGKAQALGLGFETGTVDQARADSHIHGRMYNSRDGAAIFYRYHPREIEGLCLDKDGHSRFRDEKIKIYNSVIERMEQRTANYAPDQIPKDFEVVEDEIQDDIFSSVKTSPRTVKPVLQSNWDKVNCRIKFWVTVRKALYDFMVLFTLSIIIPAYHYWTSPPEIWKRSGIFGHIADILDYILPDFFAGLIEVAVVQKPYLLLGALFVLAVYLWIRSKARRKTVDACQDKRRLVMQADRENNAGPERYLKWNPVKKSTNADVSTEDSEKGESEF